MSQAQKTPEPGDPVGDELENTGKEVRLTTFLVALSNECVQFKPVKTSEPIENSHSEIDKDPFTVLLETRKDKDNARCEAWKDEVQNLLIFVSLVRILHLKANTSMCQGRSFLSSGHCFHY